jgi:hypothetical protein
VHGYHRARVVANYVPFLNVVFNTNLIKLLCEVTQKIRVVGTARCFSHSRQVDGKALEASAQALNHTFP